MTLVIGAIGAKSIWLLVDRRLSYKGKAPRDDAQKLFVLETRDGKALLGYAGLGATRMGTEPGEWMARVVRGRNYPLEKSLGVIAEAIQTRLPPHLNQTRYAGTPAHNVIIPAFLNGESRIYTIDLLVPRRGAAPQFRYTRHVTGHRTSRGDVSPRIAVGGSGAVHLHKERYWARRLVSLINAHDLGRVRPAVVAKE